MSKRLPQPFMKRLLEAVHAVPGLEKLGKGETEADYDWVKASQVFTAIRGEFKKAEILILSNELEVRTEQVNSVTGSVFNQVTIKKEFIIRDCLSTESLKLTAFGIAQDLGDKAIWKAKTGVFKYLFRDLAVIPWLDSDDPEHDQSVNDLNTSPEQKRRGRVSAKVLGDKQIRAFASACNHGGKTAKQQALYLAELGVGSISELTPELFNTAIKWAFKNGELADVLAMSKSIEDKKSADRVMVADPEQTSQAGD